ncbi:MAG: SagB/ThcOx family dehydrogenase [FCB group bacterium]|jgi:SagB-type dehydrogenase family enzyme|nr:SagB/ThcOx family dehydrogenase [FCB group bacterium]
MEAIETVVGYHVVTKHHFHAYARSLGYLDWASQPDPFRRFSEAELHLLPLTGDDHSPAYDSVFTSGAVESRPLSLETLGSLFEHSLALSAWKQFQGERWALRCNPSSGNLHPTEGYILVDALEGLRDRPAAYHYAPKEHGLECRTEIDPGVWKTLAAGFPPGTFFAGLSSIHWREAWKYGERAYRYCQQDVGHALAALCIAAAMNGWPCVLLDGLGDAHVAALLGLDRAADFEGAEAEHPDLLLAVLPGPPGQPVPRTLPAVSMRDAHWHGRANALSREHVDWQAIEAVVPACVKPAVEVEARALSLPGPPPAHVRNLSARRIVRQRRSAVAMDGETELARDFFYGMLARTMPREGRVPWDALAEPPALHLGLFVHRVHDLAPGLYVLPRRPEAERALRKAMRQGFLWEKPASCPDALPLYTLQLGDYREAAAVASCHQDIAGDGAFSLGMLAEFEESLEHYGPWYYRHLFWEAGMIGQVLYLEAEAAGLRATGMGCYFDEPVHALFGLTDLRFQSMYHFTVGGPVEDPRLSTQPPYSEERRRLPL